MLYVQALFKILKGLGAAKRDARWSYLLLQEPEDQGIVYTPERRHTFWQKGYAENKVKRDRIVNHRGVKVIDYSSFETTLLQAVRKTLSGVLLCHSQHFGSTKARRQHTSY